MTKEEIADELFGAIGAFHSQHPEVEWKDIYEAIYLISYHYKFLAAMPSVESKSEV